MATCRASAPLLRAGRSGSTRCVSASSAASARPFSASGGGDDEYARPRSPLAQAAWDYQQEAKARLDEDGGITTETAFEILAVRPRTSWPQCQPPPVYSLPR